MTKNVDEKNGIKGDKCCRNVWVTTGWKINNKKLIKKFWWQKVDQKMLMKKKIRITKYIKKISFKYL